MIASLVIVGILSEPVLCSRRRREEASKEGVRFLALAAALLTLSVVFRSSCKEWAWSLKRFDTRRRDIKGTGSICFQFHFRIRILAHYFGRHRFFRFVHMFCFERTLRSLFPPRLCHNIVCTELFLGSTVSFPCWCTSFVPCGNIGDQQERKQECCWWTGLELLFHH